MDIKVYVLDKRIKGQYLKPIEYHYTGNYAIEIMFFRLSEIYFGKEISLKIESAIKSKLE